MRGQEKSAGILAALTENRKKLLQIAADDVRKWCVPSSQMVGKKRADTYWIELLDTRNAIGIEKDHAHQFLTSYQLTNRVNWDKPAVAALMIQARQGGNFKAVVDVPDLANNLRVCNERRTRQTSAASKISAFAKPTELVFIWDDLVSKSARWRDWLEKGCAGSIRLNAKYTDKNGEHDYGAFFNACDRAYRNELSRADFQEAAGSLSIHFKKCEGIMADRAKIPAEFIQRRLLDKLMFWEGWSIREGRLPK
jgi:hypothetical protein